MFQISETVKKIEEMFHAINTIYGLYRMSTSVGEWDTFGCQGYLSLIAQAIFLSLFFAPKGLL